MSVSEWVSESVSDYACIKDLTCVWDVQNLQITMSHSPPMSPAWRYWLKPWKLIISAGRSILQQEICNPSPIAFSQAHLGCDDPPALMTYHDISWHIMTYHDISWHTVPLALSNEIPKVQRLVCMIILEYVPIEIAINCCPMCPPCLNNPTSHSAASRNLRPRT